MARLGVLGGGHVRWLSASFMGVVLCCCVFLLTLQPPALPAPRLSMLDLPKDEVVRAQSIPALAPPLPPPSAGKHGAKKGGKGEQKTAKADKKASKAKWFKDELPKKGHATSNETKAEPVNASLPELPTARQPDSPPEDQAPASPPRHVEKSTGSETVEDTPVTLADRGTEKTGPKTRLPEILKSLRRQTDSRPPHQTDSRPPHQGTEGGPPIPPLAPRPSLHPKTTFSGLGVGSLEQFSSPFIQPRDAPRQSDAKKIITWHQPRDPRLLHHYRKVFDNCAESRCRVVYPLPEGMQADAVVFDQVDVRSQPPSRLDMNQVFVLHAMQPPSPPPPQWPEVWRAAFNWTWSYRRDADVWQPLGVLKQARRVKPLAFFESLTKGKSRALAWLPRSCPPSTPSRRHQFVEELGKHVRIAEYGPCTNRSCGKAAGSCSDNLTTRFFFLLALEDDVCKDHVTDVFYRAWHEDTHVVPVVRGGADYSAFFPEGTYIDADWFDSAGQLSAFLAELMAKRRTYSQLLWRKAHWVRAGRSMEGVGLCKLCHMLHRLHDHTKRYTDVQHWFQAGACRDPLPF